MSKQRAMQFDRELRTVQKNIAENEIKAGRLLKVIKEEELWFHIGHNYSDFDQYCDRVCGYKEGAAQTRICIVNRIDEANIKVKPTQILPISKLYEVCKVARSTTEFNKWAKKARGATTLQVLEKLVDKELVKRGEKEASQIRSKEVRKGFAFTKTGSNLVTKAAEMAVKLGDAKDASDFLVKQSKHYIEKNKSRVDRLKLKLAA